MALEPAVPRQGDGGLLPSPQDQDDGRPPVRLRLALAYDGGAFHGWAVQPGLRTVQGHLEEALATALRVQGLRTVVAGRTDTGVHATGQVVHCDVPSSAASSMDLGLLRRRLTGILPADVVVRSVDLAPAGFDARFSALWRRYRYRICDDASGLDPLRRSDTAVWSRPLDDRAMQWAADQLLGDHDFAAFCKRREGATTRRCLLELTWARQLDGVLEATVRADAFCHSMVRSLVGALALVGEGQRPGTWPAELLARHGQGGKAPSAPARGLTLVEVAYPPDLELADRAIVTRRLRQ